MSVFFLALLWLYVCSLLSSKSVSSDLHMLIFFCVSLCSWLIECLYVCGKMRLMRRYVQFSTIYVYQKKCCIHVCVLQWSCTYYSTCLFFLSDATTAEEEDHPEWWREVFEIIILTMRRGLNLNSLLYIFYMSLHIVYYFFVCNLLESSLFWCITCIVCIN